MGYKTIEFTSFVELWAQILADQERYLFPRIVLRLTHFPENYLFESMVNTGDRSGYGLREWYLVGRYFLPCSLFDKELEKRGCKSWEDKKAHISKLIISRGWGWDWIPRGTPIPDITSDGVI